MKKFRPWARYILYYFLFLVAFAAPIGFACEAFRVDHSIWYVGTSLLAGYLATFCCSPYWWREVKRDALGIDWTTKMKVTTWFYAVCIQILMPGRWTGMGKLVALCTFLGLVYHASFAIKEARALEDRE